MNAEQYSKLEPYKVHLNQAKFNFVRLSRSDANNLREIYNEIFKKDVKVSQMGCTHCVLNMLKELSVAVEKYEIWKSKFGRKKNNSDSNLNENGEA